MKICENDQNEAINEEKSPINIEQKEETIKDLDLDNDLNAESEMKLKDMIFNCLGVLFSLKQSGEVIPTENKFIKNLWNHFAENNQEEFHQINDILLNLSIKNKI